VAFTNLQSRLKNSPAHNYDVPLMSGDIAHLFLIASVKGIERSEDDINRCIDNLSDEQMWHRGADRVKACA
jgi:hypothetical protein